MARPGDPHAEFTEGPGTNELLTTNWKGSVKSQHVKYEKGVGGREKKGKKGPFGRDSNSPNKAKPSDTCALGENRPPFPPRQHTPPFKKKFIDLNSFSASDTRNRPTFSHPLLCGRLIFGHLRSIGDHFWENAALSRLVAGHPYPP